MDTIFQIKAKASMIAEVDTTFGHYRIVDEIYNSRPARVLYSGNDRIVAQSGIPRDGNIEPLFDYNQRFRELVHGIKPRRLLIVGGGVFTLPSALIREYDELLVDVVEIDAGLVGIAQQYFGLQPNDRLTIHIGDGSKFLKDTDQKFDIVIMDVFVDATIPSAFQTAAFGEHLRKHLNKHGVVAINVISSLQGLNSRAIRTMHSLLHASFDVVRIYPAARDYSLWMSQNYIVVAHDGSWDVAPYLLRSPVVLPNLKV